MVSKQEVYNAWFKKGYEEGHKKGLLSKIIQKCPYCNKLVKLNKDR